MCSLIFSMTAIYACRETLCWRRRGKVLCSSAPTDACPTSLNNFSGSAAWMNKVCPLQAIKNWGEKKLNRGNSKESSRSFLTRKKGDCNPKLKCPNHHLRSPASKASKAANCVNTSALSVARIHSLIPAAPTQSHFP